MESLSTEEQFLRLISPFLNTADLLILRLSSKQFSFLQPIIKKNTLDFPVAFRNKYTYVDLILFYGYYYCAETAFKGLYSSANAGVFNNPYSKRDEEIARAKIDMNIAFGKFGFNSDFFESNKPKAHRESYRFSATYFSFVAFSKQGWKRFYSPQFLDKVFFQFFSTAYLSTHDHIPFSWDRVLIAEMFNSGSTLCLVEILDRNYHIFIYNNLKGYNLGGWEIGNYVNDFNSFANFIAKYMKERFGLTFGVNESIFWGSLNQPTDKWLSFVNEPANESILRINELNFKTLEEFMKRRESEIECFDDFQYFIDKCFFNEQWVKVSKMVIDFSSPEIIFYYCRILATTNVISSINDFRKMINWLKTKSSTTKTPTHWSYVRYCLWCALFQIGEEIVDFSEFNDFIKASTIEPLRAIRLIKDTTETDAFFRHYPLIKRKLKNVAYETKTQKGNIQKFIHHYKHIFELKCLCETIGSQFHIC